MTRFATLWFWNAGPLDENWHKVESFSTGEHPHPSTVHQPDRPSDFPAFSWSGLDDDGNLRVGHVTDHLPDAPPLWWVLRHDPHPLGDTVSLIGFADAAFPDGTVLTVRQALDLGVGASSPQACAVRWGKGDPKIEQIYVAPEFRRRRVSIKVVHVADILNEASGWGGYIYGGTELTPDGEKLAEAWKHSVRLHPQTGTHSSLG